MGREAVIQELENHLNCTEDTENDYNCNWWWIIEASSWRIRALFVITSSTGAVLQFHQHLKRVFRLQHFYKLDSFSLFAMIILVFFLSLTHFAVFTSKGMFYESLSASPSNDHSIFFWGLAKYVFPWHIILIESEYFFLSTVLFFSIGLWYNQHDILLFSFSCLSTSTV